MRAIMPPSLTDQLFAWYGQQARDLPWRATRDPYAIWVAEVMLQQTRVATVVPYYQRWLDRFPTMEHLAAASQDDVLNAWEGLGYYRRAHNLQQAVRLVVDQHAGRLPTTSGELRRLPGIGPYTAAAIAAIAFGRDEIAVDGNLRRVIARLFDLDAPLGSAEAEQAIAGAAARLLPPGRAGDFNQALMDLGALICTPANPECPSCPLQAECLARQRGTQHQRPVRPTKGVLPTVERITAVILRNGRYLVCGNSRGETWQAKRALIVRWFVSWSRIWVWRLSGPARGAATSTATHTSGSPPMSISALSARASRSCNRTTNCVGWKRIC
jgi:A/G-specific adenine glycosylase